MAIKKFTVNSTPYELKEHVDTLEINENSFKPQVLSYKENTLTIALEDVIYKAVIEECGETTHIWIGNNSYQIHKENSETKAHSLSDTQKTNISAPLAGRVIKSFITPAQPVKKNDPLLTIESMKMENEIRSTRDGFIKSISFKEGDLVKANQVLITFDD